MHVDRGGPIVEVEVEDHYIWLYEGAVEMNAECRIEDGKKEHLCNTLALIRKIFILSYLKWRFWHQFG